MQGSSKTKWFLLLELFSCIDVQTVTVQGGFTNQVGCWDSKPAGEHRRATMSLANLKWSHLFCNSD